MKSTMKGLSFVLIVLQCTIRWLPAQAAPNYSEIRVLQRAPADVLARMPRGGKTLIFAIAKIGPNHSDVLLHYYSVPNPKPTISKRTIEFLGLFTRVIPQKQGKQSVKLRQLNLIKLEGDELSWFQYPVATSQFSDLAIMWLEPKQKLGSILKLTGSGSSDSFLFIMFPKGLNGTVTMQAFGSGSNGNSFVETTFDKVDERGFMVIDEWGGEVNNGEPTTWGRRRYWNGTKFAERRTKK